MAFYRQNLFFSNFLLTWLLLFSLLRTAQHFSFATNTWDLSIFDYAISNTLKWKQCPTPAAKNEKKFIRGPTGS